MSVRGAGPGPVDIDTVVIGGGQAGLAVGYFLRRRGLGFVILDRADEVGAVWRRRWDSLRLVMLGAYLLGRSWIRPATVDASTHRRGYVRGLAQLGRLWLPALALFAVGAIYEVLEINYLVPLVRGG